MVQTQTTSVRAHTYQTDSSQYLALKTSELVSIIEYRAEKVPQDYRMVWVGRTLKNHLPPHHCRQGHLLLHLGCSVLSVQSDFEHFQ